MQHFNYALLFFLLCCQFFGEVTSQPVEIRSPLEIPLLLSGNFGELREHHFHAGIDLRTNGESGAKIFALAPGYVSRVKIQAGGYGHSVYITHLNGFTSVYAHLESFFPELEEYVKQQQYQKKSFEVNLYPDKYMFIITKGQQIGVSGNTGSSGGPHLHLEYRDPQQVPNNLLKYNLPIKDTIPPVFRNLVVYDGMDKETFQWNKKLFLKASGYRGKYTVKVPVKVDEVSAFGIEVYDYLNGTSYRCGIYTLRFYVNNSLIYSMQLDKVSFSETKYIYTHSDFEEKKFNKKGVHRLFIEPNNKLSIYNSTLHDGVIILKDSAIHNAKIIATDVYGNKSVMDFSIVRNHSKNHKNKQKGDILLKYDEGNTVEKEGIKLFVPANALYANKRVNISTDSTGQGFLKHVFIIGDEAIPVHKYPELSLKIDQPLVNVLPDKLVIAKIEKDGEIISEGGKWDNNWLTAKISGFGKYIVLSDTTAPKIKPVSFKSGSWYGPKDIISFKIEDELSKIESYKGYINGSWCLFEYDKKNDLLFYEIDAVRLKSTQKNHTLKLYIRDERGNLATYTGTFNY